ncbi:MAG: hypothetical protein ACRDI2_18700, partial [Chloroflexota bacterium]
VTLVICAWCEANGRPHGAVRPRRSRRWRTVSHAFTRALKLAGLTDYGVCPACAPKVARDWGIEMAG